jgi:hypothetical protein
VFIPKLEAPARSGLSLFSVQAGTDFSEPEIDHFVMAITSFEARVRHSTRHQTAELPLCG